ncbi:MAG TPA: UvrD-helicase domain-containing protein [Bacilli bacterium]|nr:UvrD-helicase domain-containing protein [Bacilli bacterium]
MNLDYLNERQKEAVFITEGPLLILAGAGSGKTKVLTTKIAYLVKEKGISPSNILAITFTNKAAKEMKERVIDLVGISAYNIQISTFHSFGLKIIKENYNVLGYNKNFTILDSDDSLSVIKKILKELNYDATRYNPKMIKNKISSAKNELISPSNYKKLAYDDIGEIISKVYSKYEEKLKINNSVDFDDLLLLPIKLFKENKYILENYQEIYKYIFIDEYQDTNEAQYQLSKTISEKYKNICVVGDNDQSIYSWRGANYKNILNFEKDNKNTNIILLEQNYRSTKTILEAANCVIKNNIERKDKILWTENECGNKIKYIRANDERQEANKVVKEIINLQEQGIELNKIAVLYRMNSQSRVLEEELLTRNIPYKVVGAYAFYNRKEIKDLLAYLKLIYNQQDDVSLLRIINYPRRKIGEKTIEELSTKAILEGKSLFEAISSGKELEFKHMMLEIINQVEKVSLTELIDIILDKTGIREELKSEKTLEADIRLENLEEFKSITKSFEANNGIISLSDFLDEISLVSELDEKDNENVPKLNLMTIHAVKGLEFSYVFVVGLEENIFPHINSFESNNELEEERRLFYVAVTRTKKQLYLFNTFRRTLMGNTNINPPSRFISEIDKIYIDNNDEKEEVIMNNYYNDDIDIKAGESIIHNEFGKGIVISVEKSIITVAFKKTGIKKLMKNHKSIKKV